MLLIFLGSDVIRFTATQNELTLKKQLETYQQHLIAAEPTHVKAVEFIDKALNKIFSYPFNTNNGKMLGTLYTPNPQKLVPEELHTVVTDLTHEKTKKMISKVNFEHLVANIEALLLSALGKPVVKQEQLANKTKLSSWSLFQFEPTKPLLLKEFYFDLLTGFKSSGLITVSQQDIADQIHASTKDCLANPLIELVSSYVC